MEHVLFAALRGLSDDEVRSRLRGTAHRMQAAAAELIAHLAEVEEREIHLEELVAALDPKPDAASSLRRLPAPPATQASAAKPAVPVAATTPPPVAAPPATVAALSPDCYRLQVTISGSTVEKLRLAQDLSFQAALDACRPPSPATS